jgi:carboxypeptidase Taq
MMSKHYDALVGRFKKLGHLQHAQTFLSWDQQVMMPNGGNAARSEALSELAGMGHELLTSPELSDWFASAEEEALTADQQVSLFEMRRQWQQAACMPGDLVRAQSLAASHCEHDWRGLRADNNWAGFLPKLDTVVGLAQQEAAIRKEAGNGRFETPYDAMLDLYSTGDTSALIGSVFTTLKEALPPLLQEIQQKQTPLEPLQGPFDIAQQEQLSRALMAVLGFNFDSGRLDVSAHPFSTGGLGDQRITTRYRTTEFAEALLATAHETGHASYEAGLPLAWSGLPVGQARSMSIHESQSLLFEKQVFLAKPFVAHFAPQVHQHLPSTQSISAAQLWRHYTHVAPGLIRVEADEVTYPLHVILRHEIESALMNGGIKTRDIPELWDNGMMHYLGLDTRGNFKDGCMQDVHWAGGAFGYFPSYTLGALNAAQQFAQIKQVHGDWEARLAAGDVSFVRDWLSTHIWKKASLLSTPELMTQATGQTTDPQYFIDHVHARYLRNAY